MTINNYPVEVKLTVGGDIDDALQVLKLDDGRARTVWFLEDPIAGSPDEIPLLDVGVILRLRGDARRDQSTVKLRPARVSQLVGKWAEAFEDSDTEYRVEGDWAGPRRVLSASCVRDWPTGTFKPLTGGDGDLSAAFSEGQREFIAECAGIPLDISTLAAYGPIRSTQWRDQQLGNVSVDVERWTVDSQDFLEISARATNETLATRSQTALTEAATTLGLKLAAEQAPRPKPC